MRVARGACVDTPRSNKAIARVVKPLQDQVEALEENDELKTGD